MPKHRILIFQHYYEAVMYCINNDITGYSVEKYQTRRETTYDWVVRLRGQKMLKG
jgi:hypothetical protein